LPHGHTEASNFIAQSQSNYSTTWNEAWRTSDISFSAWKCRSDFPFVLAKLYQQQDESEALWLDRHATIVLERPQIRHRLEA
jgi:hypothetical protein